MSLLSVISGVIDFAVNVAKFVYHLIFGRASNPSDDIIFNPFSIWLIMGFWIFLICTVINLMMKASDPFASRERKEPAKPMAGMDLDVMKLMQAKKNEDKQQKPQQKDPNFKPDRVK